MELGEDAFVWGVRRRRPGCREADVSLWHGSRGAAERAPERDVPGRTVMAASAHRPNSAAGGRWKVVRITGIGRFSLWAVAFGG